MKYGPKLPISEEVGLEKHRQKGESFEQAKRREAAALADGPEHQAALERIYLENKFLNAGRVQKAAGSMHDITAFNCFVSADIGDNMDDIFSKLKEAALTMQKGGGIGYNFGTIRPNGSHVKGVDSFASGPLSFMRVYDQMCLTIMSAGARRGAMMGVLPVWHPDIEAFVSSKTNQTEMRNFNISVGITDAFMVAVLEDKMFHLEFGGTVYKTVRAVELWDKITQATWDWAEPGVLFMDRINDRNNLWYCETISATNPCGEQPLPPYGACLLGSINWAAYVVRMLDGSFFLDVPAMLADVPHIVRALDNVIDRTIFPLPEQEREAKMKRRMGIGATGVANAVEAVTGAPYGSERFCRFADKVQKWITEATYMASVELAKEKGAFPLYSQSQYLQSHFIQSLPEHVQKAISKHGIRNSHLISMAPTGSISLAADNISSGIEPVFSLEYDRGVLQQDGTTKTERVTDFGMRVFGTKGRTASELTPDEHVNVLAVFQKHTDSACSKTCNIGPATTFEEFKQVYINAYNAGAKGCTTFRASGKRFGVLNEIAEEEEIEEGAACYIDPETGLKSCD